MATKTIMRDRIVALRLTDAEYAMLADAARADDRPVSVFVRIHVLAAALQASVERAHDP